MRSHSWSGSVTGTYVQIMLELLEVGDYLFLQAWVSSCAVTFFPSFALPAHFTLSQAISQIAQELRGF